MKTCHNVICSYSESCESNIKVIAELFKGIKKETSLSLILFRLLHCRPYHFLSFGEIWFSALQHFAKRQLKESFVTVRSLSIIEVAYRWTLYCYECQHVPLSGNLFWVLSFEIDIRHSDWQRGKKNTVLFVKCYLYSAENLCPGKHIPITKEKFYVTKRIPPVKTTTESPQNWKSGKLGNFAKFSGKLKFVILKKFNNMYIKPPQFWNTTNLIIKCKQ